MHVSDEEIWDKRTAAAKHAGVASWSRAQLAEWGVPWPPPKGWRRELNGGVYCDHHGPQSETRARGDEPEAVRAARDILEWRFGPLVPEWRIYRLAEALSGE